MIIGFTVLVIGIILLLNSVGVLSFLSWSIVWGILCIALGLVLLFRQRNRRSWWDIFDNQTPADWEKWGREFGDRIENWANSLKHPTSDSARSWGEELGKSLENGIQKIFSSSDKSKNDGADQRPKP